MARPTVPNLYRVAGNRTAALEAMLGFNEALAKGAFDARTREAIALAVAGANGCDYCAAAHSAVSRRLKVDESSIDAHLNGRSGDPKTAAILRLAVAIVEKRGRVPDSALDAAWRAGLNDGDTLSLKIIPSFNGARLPSLPFVARGERPSLQWA